MKFIKPKSDFQKIEEQYVILHISKLDDITIFDLILFSSIYFFLM